MKLYLSLKIKTTKLIYKPNLTTTNNPERIEYE